MTEQFLTLAKEHNIPAYAVTVIRDGEAETVRINPANDCNDIYSISKNFTATAIGMLCDRGLLTTETSIREVLAPLYPDMPAVWDDCTVGHVLCQTTGIEHGFLDIDCEDAQTFGDDWLRFTLYDHAPTVKPGTLYRYSDSNFYLLSRVFAQAAGEKMMDFMQREFFVPMGFQGQAWAVCPAGHAMGGTGLFIRVPDMAKLGQLYLDGGVYNGRRYLSGEWCRRATKQLVFVGGNDGYGYSFWKNIHEPSDFFCGGMNGQAVRVYPEKRLVIAWQAHDHNGTLGHFCALADRLGHTE
ncbi:MAG: serine hydrolase [Clostridia bacterium]|nr:serine hydrolase [Clostridia bacterium]